MMMKMLVAGGVPVLIDERRAADDDNPEGYFELEAVKKTEQDASWVKDAPGKAVKVIYRLLEHLPGDHHYQVLLMERAIDEVIASQQVMLQRRGTEGAKLDPDQLQSIFSRELQRVKSWVQAQDNFDLIEIPYARVLDDAESESERVRRFLSIPLDVPAMAAQVNRQLYRQRR